MRDLLPASLWMAFRLGLSNLLSDKEKKEVSDITYEKIEYIIKTENRFPNGDEIMQMFEKTYDDIYRFYHGI